VNGEGAAVATRYAGKRGDGLVADDNHSLYQYSTVAFMTDRIHDGGIMVSDSFRERDRRKTPNVERRQGFRGRGILSQAIEGGTSQAVLPQDDDARGCVTVGFQRPGGRGRADGGSGGRRHRARREHGGIVDGTSARSSTVHPGRRAARTDAAGPALLRRIFDAECSGADVRSAAFRGSTASEAGIRVRDNSRNDDRA